MTPEMVEKLLDDVQQECYVGLDSLGLLGRTADMMQFRAALRTLLGYEGGIELYTIDDVDGGTGQVRVHCCSALQESKSRILVVVEDDEKEAALSMAREWLPSQGVKILLAGYGHYAFRQQAFADLVDSLLVPSIANGYPNCLIHIFQCLEHAARTGLQGSVAEFGVFKGGTTRFLAEAVASMGQSWQIYGFDTFDGFPPRRSALDMYDHQGAEYSRFNIVAQYLSDTGVELVKGDITETASVLGDNPMVLSFVDTDNYSAASAAIRAVIDTTVVGGAIVLDHYTGESRFRYTLGERMAANELLAPDPRYFNLHGTGVFLRCM